MCLIQQFHIISDQQTKAPTTGPRTAHWNIGLWPTVQILKLLGKDH
ncbi:hypothetical protein cypCar_00020387 [Cyprinus carpio]|nr:hypothetical protein cypCar_00020387 [Cyprinus carpio]